MSELWRTRRICTLRSRLTLALVAGAVSAVVVAGALAANTGKSLIGKLEGPEVVTDPAKFPKTFTEAPQLAELVKAGKLPPVAERIGQDPLVIKPLHEIGRYGGTWRGGFTGPADFWNGFRCCSGPYFMLPDVLAGSTDLAGQMFGYRALGGFAPAHYLKQFHPKYVGQAELDKKVKDEKFDSWVRMFLFKNDWALNPELPVLSAWK